MIIICGDKISKGFFAQVYPVCYVYLYIYPCIKSSCFHDTKTARPIWVGACLHNFDEDIEIKKNDRLPCWAAEMKCMILNIFVNSSSSLTGHWKAFFIRTGKLKVIRKLIYNHDRFVAIHVEKCKQTRN